MGLIEIVSTRIIILLIQDMIQFGLIYKQRDMRKEQSVRETDLIRFPVEANIGPKLSLTWTSETPSITKFCCCCCFVSNHNSWS